MSRTHSQQLADRHEGDLAKDMPEFHRTSASGSKMEKSDLISDHDDTDFVPMIECKSTQKKSYSVTLELLSLLKERATNRGLEYRPTLAIRFYDEDDRVLADWIAVPKEDYRALLDFRDSY